MQVQGAVHRHPSRKGQTLLENKQEVSVAGVQCSRERDEQDEVGRVAGARACRACEPRSGVQVVFSGGGSGQVRGIITGHREDIDFRQGRGRQRNLLGSSCCLPCER